MEKLSSGWRQKKLLRKRRSCRMRNVMNSQSRLATFHTYCHCRCITVPLKMSMHQWQSTSHNNFPTPSQHQRSKSCPGRRRAEFQHDGRQVCLGGCWPEKGPARAEVQGSAGSAAKQVWSGSDKQQLVRRVKGLQLWMFPMHDSNPIDGQNNESMNLTLQTREVFKKFMDGLIQKTGKLRKLARELETTYDDPAATSSMPRLCNDVVHHRLNRCIRLMYASFISIIRIIVVHHGLSCLGAWLHSKLTLARSMLHLTNASLSGVKVKLKDFSPRSF